MRRKLAERWIELEGAAVPIFIHAHRDVSRSFDRHWTPVHLDFIVPSLPEAIERATAAGGDLEKRVDIPPRRDAQPPTRRPGVARVGT